MEARKRPQVKPIQTGSTGIKPWERRSSRDRGVPLPSPLRCSMSTSDLPFNKDGSCQSATKCFPKTPYPRHGIPGQGLASRRLTRSQRKIQLARLDAIHANTIFSPRTANGPKTSPLDNQVARLMSFQRYRDALWRRGSQCLSHDDDADVFVNAISMRKSSTGCEVSPTSPHSQPVRVVIHSKGRQAFGLTRQFDMDHLRATVPDASPSPRSAGFDKEALISAVLQQAVKSPSAVPDTDAFRSDISSPEESSAGSPTGQTQVLGLPIHLQYARASLPVLASIMMSPQIRHGDTIDLPIPHPEAWPETVAFVYTGEEELMTELVRKNMYYLGGRP